LISTLTEGGRVLVSALADNGLTRGFCVPGESFLPVLDAFYDTPGMQLISCRQEGGAALMAESYAKTTGVPAACFVTRGPGASNAMAGIHVASQDSTPLLLFVGQIPRNFRDREAWQEMDVRTTFAPHVKWVAEIDDAARVTEYVGHAVRTAIGGRPGPVVLGLPEDMLYEQVAVTDVRPAQPVEIPAAPAALDQLSEWVAQAKAPLMIVGGGYWSRQVQAHVEAFAERHGMALVTAWRRQDYVDNLHANYAGHAGLGMNPALAHRIKAADLLIVFGSRLSDVTTAHYTLVDVPRPKQRLIHIHSAVEELGRVYQPDIAICATPAACARALAELPTHHTADVGSHGAWLEAAHHDYLTWSDPTNATQEGAALAESVAWLSRELSAEAVLTNGAGNYTLWLHRFYRYRRFGAQLAPSASSMGYGLPAAIAAGLAEPARDVVCFAGDGCFLMTGQELATAVHYGVKVIVILINNGIYGSIRMHQQRHYPDRLSGTTLTNPDFVALARSFGLAAYRVEDCADFQSVFKSAQRETSSVLIEFVLDSNILRP
jgi:acetolactate synthase-1/2/3 large subunit